MPVPIPLPMPPGDPDVIAQLVDDLRSAVRCLASVDVRLSEPASSTVGWLGDDATAAAAQVTAVAGLIRAACDAVTPATGRLAAHAEHLLETRSRIKALLHEQEHQFREAWRRWYALPDLQAQLMIDGPGVRAIVADVEAGEASRRRRHHALLEEIDDDAAATARVLVDASAVVGGRGRTGDANGVVAYLAAELPGWGDRELGRRARALAHDFEVLPPDRWNERARSMSTFAGLPAFARALLQTIGQRGLRNVLGLLGRRTFSDDMDGRSSDVSRFLGSVLGAAASNTQGPTDLLLTATYVGEDAGTDSDYVAMGMAMVLVAGAPNGGPGPMTVASWTRQVLAREYTLAGQLEGSRAVDRVYPNAQFDEVTTDDSFRRFDPVPVLVQWLADHGTPQSAAASLAERTAWTVLLDRSWDDAGSSLAAVVSMAAADPGAAGARAAWSGLGAIGAGLVEGDPSRRAVDRDVVAAVAPALGQLVASHVPVATSALAELGGDAASGETQEVLRGFGYLTLDRAAADVVSAALEAWAQVQPHELTGTSAAAPLPAIAVPSAYVAVQQYGQRLAYALDQYEAREAADFRKRVWTAATLPLVFISGPAGIATGIAAGYLAIPLDMDGTWDAEPDRGRFFDAADAARAASADDGTSTASPLDRAVVAHQARVAYERASVALGVPSPPVSADPDVTAPVRDALRGLVWGRITRGHAGIERVGSAADHLFG